MAAVATYRGLKNTKPSTFYHGWKDIHEIEKGNIMDMIYLNYKRDLAKN